MLDKIYIPVIKISQGSVCTYALPYARPSRTKAQEDTEKNLTRGVFKGEISDKSRKNLKRMAEGWILAIQESKKTKALKDNKIARYITFVTLTLSAKQAHSDKEIKRELLNKFIINCQRKFKVQEYIWRAEAQANGNIHFHLFLDRFIPHQELRIVWNQVQESLGYISRFEEKYHHTNPNSTDIEQIKTVKGATNYITKYIAKESKYRKIEGRLWGCSDNLRKIQGFEQQIDSRFSALLEYIDNCKKIRKIQDSHYTVWLGDIREIIESNFAEVARMMKYHYQDIFRQVYC